MSNRFFEVPDGLSGPELWQHNKDRTFAPALVLRKADLPGPYDELLWRVVTGVLAPDEATVERVTRVVHAADCDCDDLRSHGDYYLDELRAVLAALADPADTGGAA